MSQVQHVTFSREKINVILVERVHIKGLGLDVGLILK
jgi:hypothetical protein